MSTSGLPYYPLTNAGVNDAQKINADLNYLAGHVGAPLTGPAGATGAYGGPPGATGVPGMRGVAGLANFTEGPVFPTVYSDPHFHHHTIDDIWYVWDKTTSSWIDVSTGAMGITGPRGLSGIQGLANFYVGELPQLPSPNQPEFFFDESDEVLYFWYTGAQAWVDIQTGCKGITGAQGMTGIVPPLVPSNIVQQSFSGILAYTGLKIVPGSATIITLGAPSRVMSVFQVDSIAYNYVTQYTFNGVTGLLAGPNIWEKNETYISPVLPAGSYTGACLAFLDSWPPYSFTGIIFDGQITLIALDSGQGPAGETGTGATGLMGPTGAYGGPPGETGVRGMTGLAGTNGTNGAIGVTGLQGTTGLRGITGIVGLGLTGVLNITVGGLGTYITTGYKTDITLPFNLSFCEWSVLNDVAGSILYGVWRDTYANFPPTSADAMHSGATGPNTVLAAKNKLTGLSTWGAPTGAEGDVVRINVDSATGIQRSVLSLRYFKI